MPIGCAAPALYHIVICKSICNRTIWYGRCTKGAFNTLITISFYRTAADLKAVAKRPAAGGESCKAGFFVPVIQQKSPFRYNIVVQAILLRKVEKYIYGESNGLWYELQGDYLT